MYLFFARTLYLLCTYYVPTYLHSATFVSKLSFFSFVHTFMDYSFVIILATLCKNTSRFTYTSHSIFGMFLNFIHSCGFFLQYFLRNSTSKKNKKDKFYDFKVLDCIVIVLSCSKKVHTTYLYTAGLRSPRICNS